MSERGWCVVELPVQWADMDALGHVNNARYFTWFESARIALFGALGMIVREQQPFGPVLATTTCDFLVPVVYPARIRARARISKVGTTSLAMDYEVRDAERPELLYARGNSVAVLIEYASSNKVPVDTELRARIEAYRGDA